MRRSETWGVTYVDPGEKAEIGPSPRDRYHFSVYVRTPFVVEKGDSAYSIGVSYQDDIPQADIIRGPSDKFDAEVAVVIRGLMLEPQRRTISRATFLPYVNGCSTKQIFPPDRAGDPTLQYLDIPPFSAEQAHHIHSTTRVVYILEGKGVSVVGMEGKIEKTDLLPGMVCVLEPMCPHHFETPQGQHLVCLPVHVWSSSGSSEFNHPMFAGTFMMNQGG